MVEYLTKHWLLSILVTILLGALGSGLWESIFKPVFYKIGRFLFTLLTFRLKRASDNVYKEASRGHHDKPSMTVLMLLVIAISVFFVTIAEHYYEKASHLTDSSIDKIPQECVEKKNSEQRDCINKALKEGLKDLKMYVNLLGLVAIFISVMVLIPFLTIVYINGVITYYEQCLKICKPFLGAEEVLKIEQRFALMESKEDYLKIIKQLDTVAEKESIKLPQPYY